MRRKASAIENLADFLHKPRQCKLLAGRIDTDRKVMVFGELGLPKSYLAASLQRNPPTNANDQVGFLGNG
jgi:hypothetical protein